MSLQQLVSQNVKMVVGVSKLECVTVDLPTMGDVVKREVSITPMFPHGECSCK